MKVDGMLVDTVDRTAQSHIAVPDAVLILIMNKSIFGD